MIRQTLNDKIIQMKKILLIAILLFVGTPSCFCQDSEVQVFISPESMPEFEKGGINEFQLWTYKNLKYPEEAIQRSISGKLYVTFTVDSTGYIKNVKIYRSAGTILDNEAIRVVQSSPKWIPGKLYGKYTRTEFTMPIVFDLKDKDFKRTINKIERPLRIKKYINRLLKRS